MSAGTEDHEKHLLEVPNIDNNSDAADQKNFKHRLSFNVEDDMDGLLKWITSCSGGRSKQLVENEDNETYGFSDHEKHEKQKENILKQLKRTLSEGKSKAMKYKERLKRSKSQEDKRTRHAKRQDSYKEAVINDSVRLNNSLPMPETTSRVPFVANVSNEIGANTEANTSVPNAAMASRENTARVQVHKVRDTNVQHPSSSREQNNPSSYPCQTNVQSHPSTRYRKRHEAIVSPDVYNFTYPERGFLVNIVNDRFIRQSSREGAHWDLSKMREVGRKFGFRLFNYGKDRNLSRNQTLSLLTRIQREDHSDCDCFMFMISTHGFEQRNPMMDGKLDHALVCADDQLIFTSTILKMFNDTNCPSLKGKPKIFFIQACRGEQLDHGSNVFVLFPRSRDRADVTVEQGLGPPFRKKESVDEYDTKPGADSWAGQNVQYPGQTTTSSDLQYGQQTWHTEPHQVPTRPEFYTPRNTQYSTQTRSPIIRANYTVSSVPFRPTGGASSVASGRDLFSENKSRPLASEDTPSLKCSNDMLVMYAIPQGMFAWRNASDGSWMIDYLHQILMSHNMNHPKSFLNLLTKVAAVMSCRETNTPSSLELDRKKAIPVIEHKLDRDVIFQPKVKGSPWVKRFHNMAL